MEKRLRSSLQNSAEEFLLSSTRNGFKAVKPSLKTLIWSIKASSDLSSSLPIALHQFVTRSIESFKQLLELNNGDFSKSPRSPPMKRLRRSSRQRKNPKESSTVDSGPKISSERQVLLQNLKIYAYIAVLSISHPKKPFSPSDILPSVRALHDNLILFELDPVLLSEIANLCEEWWKEQLPERETLISQFLPFLLSRSLTLRKKVDVRRVYALREAFSLFDFDDESIEDLKLLLVRCIITPLYLKIEEGRRFIAFLFGLSRQLVKEALAIIRSQIPFGRKSMLEAYADILFRAWKIVEGPSRDEIESGFLQSLIEGAIHASSGAFAASIRRILGGFINHRTTDGVEKLLFRLAEPVVFRSLQVANSNVRQNALHLLLDMFPLEDPDATKEVKDTLLDKQFFLLERLLIDDCPDVRVVAVEGSCRILRLFWEIIPSSTISKIISKIVDEMSHDICNEVRISTVNGIIYLLDNPQTHEVLKVLLPRLGHLFLDSVLSVRIAVADLLLVLRNIRTFQVNKVVTLDALLSTLANDQPPVAQKITRLLIQSYFPSKVTLEEACNRCVTLIKRSPMAGARFCEFALSEGASMTSLMELLRVIVRLVLSPDNQHADQIEGFLVAAAHLCQSLVGETCCRSPLKQLFSGEKLKCLLNAAVTRRAQTSVFSIASIISPDDVTGILEECMGLIMSCSGLSENVERQAEVRSAHKLFMSCDAFDDMFVVLVSLLQKAVSGCHVKFGTEIPKQSVPASKRNKAKYPVKISTKWKHVKGKKKSTPATSNFEEDYAIAAGVAWQIKDLLMSVHTRYAVLNSQILELAFSALHVLSDVSIEQCMYYEYMETSPVLAYTSLTMHMTLQNVSLTGTNNHGDNEDTGLNSARSSLERTVLDHSINHLLNCTEKLFGVIESGKVSNLSSESKQDDKKMAQRRRHKQRESQTGASSPNDGGSNSCEQNKFLNLLKMFTAVLKFIVDATTMCLVSNNQEKCLQFTSAYVQYIISTLRKHSPNLLQFKEEDLREAFLCLKSSSTYAAKLLKLVLTNSSETSLPSPEASDLANNLLDLSTVIELYLGSGYAKRLVAAIKPWLPDLILALGSRHILIKTPPERGCSSASNHCKLRLLPWLSILGKIELCEISEDSHSEEAGSFFEPDEFSMFKKLMEMIVLLLRGNPKVLDAIGIIVMDGLAVGLEREDFGMVLGLVHFVCIKLVRHEHVEWEELEMMLASLQELYPQIKSAVMDPRISEDGKQMLESARALLEPVWMKYIFEDGGKSMMEE
ncbi:hypothetical protein HHK36_008292 [Tetracentron sinense]|uniref:Condensin-2 complex subunit G2 n=1 Tax=Tetracentron sinense TaxID=13715 RepID=A0A834ZPX1_TETSI|nr:hypothetical protein HHK36_008292 [Tetracentron sinense]